MATMATATMATEMEATKAAATIDKIREIAEARIASSNAFLAEKNAASKRNIAKFAAKEAKAAIEAAEKAEEEAKVAEEDAKVAEASRASTARIVSNNYQVHTCGLCKRFDSTKLCNVHDGCHYCNRSYC